MPATPAGGFCGFGLRNCWIRLWNADGVGALGGVEARGGSERVRSCLLIVSFSHGLSFELASDRVVSLVAVRDVREFLDDPVEDFDRAVFCFLHVNSRELFRQRSVVVSVADVVFELLDQIEELGVFGVGHGSDQV